MYNFGFMCAVDGTFLVSIHTQQGDIGNGPAADVAAVTFIKRLMRKLTQECCGIVVLYGVGFCSHGQLT